MSSPLSLRTFLKAAALAVALTQVVPVHATKLRDYLNPSLSDPTLPLNTAISTAISDYALAPTDANYSSMITSIAAARSGGAFPINFITSNVNIDETSANGVLYNLVTGGGTVLGNGAAGLQLSAGTQFKVEVINTLLDTTNQGILYRYDSLAVFTTEGGGAGYTFTGNGIANSPVLYSAGFAVLTDAVFSENFTWGSPNTGFHNAGTAAITRARFEGNSAAAGNGVAILNAADRDNSSSSYYLYNEGGRPAPTFVGDLALVDVVFHANTVGTDYNYWTGIIGGNGAAIYNAGGNIHAVNTTFTENRAGPELPYLGISTPFGSGGAIYNTNDEVIPQIGNINMKQTSFHGNKAIDAGGAIYNRDAVISIEDAVFSANIAYNEAGGAIYNDSGTVSVTRGTFFGNVGRDGGAISSTVNMGVNPTPPHLTVTDSSFYNNRSDPTVPGSRGGAIQVDAGTLNLTVTAGKTSVFYANQSYGGAPNSIDIRGGASMNVTTGAGAVLYMLDPMVLGDSTIVKSGTGTWKLAGTSSRVGTEAPAVTVQAGTLHLYGAAESVTNGGNVLVIPNGQRSGGGVYSNLSIGVPPVSAGVLQTNSLVVNSGAKLVMGGVGSNVVVPTSGTGVTLAPGSEVVFKVISETQLGKISTNNLTISGSNLVLDLSTPFANIAGPGTILDLFLDSAGSVLLRPLGDFSSIEDSGRRFEWEMLPTGQVWIKGVKSHPDIIPEPSTYGLLGGFGVLAFALWRRRKAKG